MKRSYILIGVLGVLAVVAAASMMRRSRVSPAGVVRGEPAPTELACKNCGFSITLQPDEVYKYTSTLPSKVTDDGVVTACRKCKKFGLQEVFPEDAGETP